MELLPHQIEDGAVMATGDALNWSGMGTGKTLTALEAFRVSGSEAGLIIAPPIALTMWETACAEFFGPECVVSVLRTGKDRIWPRSKIVITTYGLAAAGQNENVDQYFYEFVGKKAMILDEAHAVKSKDTKRAAAILDYGQKGSPLSQLFDYIWQLTGTPITRYYDDLFTQLMASHPDVLRHYKVDTYDRWSKTFCTGAVRSYHKSQAPKYVVVGNKNGDKLKSLLAECLIIQRTLDEVVDELPPITYRVLEMTTPAVVKLDRELARFANAAEIDVAQGLKEEEPALVEAWQKLGLARLDIIADYIASPEVVKPVLVGHWFNEFGDRLSEALTARGVGNARLYGGTRQRARDKLVEQFNAGDLPVLVGQISAMSTSLNLQGTAHRVILAEDYYSPKVLDQFIGRIYRRGQKNHVQVDYVKSEHTIDKVITTLKKNKRDGTERVGL